MQDNIWLEFSFSVTFPYFLVLYSAILHSFIKVFENSNRFITFEDDDFKTLIFEGLH